MKRTLAVLGGGVLVLAACASAVRQESAPEQRQAPTLVVMITVDQLRGDYLDRFASQLTGGYARIRGEGAFFTQAAQDHGIPMTAPGHSTVLSGRHPVHTGILRNDEGVPDTSANGRLLGGSRQPGASPWRFRGTVLIDWMVARWPNARAFSISRKDRGAILPLGRGRQHTVVWYDTSIGGFNTSRWYRESLPEWVAAFNRQAEPAHFAGYVWQPLMAASEYTEVDSVGWEHSGRDVSFPHQFPEDSVAMRRRMTNLPQMDSLTLALALEAVSRLRLGNGSQPDLLAVSLSQTDEVGHNWGPNSREIHDHIIRTDRWLGTFLDSLGKLRDMRRVVIALTADHGVHTMPEWSWANGEQGRRYVDVDSVLRRHRARARAVTGDTTLRTYGYREYSIVTSNRAALVAKGLNPDSMYAAMAEEIRRVPGVMRVDTRESIFADRDTINLVVRRWQHMLFPEVPVALLITLDEGNVFVPGRGEARHGDLSTEGSWVTLALWGAGIRAGRYDQRVSTVDIAPTLARLLGIAPTERVDGRVLTEALAAGR